MINKRGAVGLAVLFAIVYFMAGMVIYQFIKPDIAVARGATEMNCAAPATAGDMSVCIIFDFIIPYFVLGCLAAAGGIVTQNAIK